MSAHQEPVEPALLCDTKAVVQCFVGEDTNGDLVCDANRVCWFINEKMPNTAKRLKTTTFREKLPLVSSSPNLGEKARIAGVCVTGMRTDVDAEKFPDVCRRVVVQVAGEVFVSQKPPLKHLDELIPGDYVSPKLGDENGGVEKFDQANARSYILGMVGRIDFSPRNPGLVVILTPQQRMRSLSDQRVLTRDEIIEHWNAVCVKARNIQSSMSSSGSTTSSVESALESLVAALNENSQAYNAETANTVKQIVNRSALPAGNTRAGEWMFPDPTKMSTHVLNTILEGGFQSGRELKGIKDNDAMIREMLNAPADYMRADTRETALVYFSTEEQECIRRWVHADKQVGA